MLPEAMRLTPATVRAVAQAERHASGPAQPIWLSLLGVTAVVVATRPQTRAAPEAPGGLRQPATSGETATTAMEVLPAHVIP